jgi:hypothetical protein
MNFWMVFCRGLCHLDSFKNSAKARYGAGIGWLDDTHDANLLPFLIVTGALHYVYTVF